MNKEIFGGFIADLRRVAGMTQKQVADRLHVTDRAVSKWERGLSYPDVTLMEPLAVVLGVGVEELLTCRRKEAPAPEPELPALRSVLTITQEEKRIRTRRTRVLLCAAAAVLVLAVLITMQHNGKLFYERRTTSPGGDTTFTVYRDSLLDGELHIKLNHPMSFEGAACRYCGRGATEWTDRQELGWGMTSAEELSWSADGRYLLIRGGGSNGKSMELVLWDFAKYGEDSPVHSSEITLDILQQLSGFDAYEGRIVDGQPWPDLILQPLLPALPGTGWLPQVSLSDVRWIGGSHRLTMTYAYDGTDGLHRSGQLTYDADTETVVTVE